jgi:hypothetical protein
MENRRHFILSSFAMMTAVASGLKALVPESKGTHNLVPGEIVLVKAGMSFNLPAQPQDGDSVVLVVRSTSLEQPSIVTYKSSKIVGDREALELDSMANVRLVYHAPTDNWNLA